MPHSVLEIHCIIIITVPGCIAGTDAPVHEEGDDGHDDAEDGEEHLKRGGDQSIVQSTINDNNTKYLVTMNSWQLTPVLADLGKGVLPDDGDDVGDAGVEGGAAEEALLAVDLLRLPPLLPPPDLRQCVRSSTPIQGDPVIRLEIFVGKVCVNLLISSSALLGVGERAKKNKQIHRLSRRKSQVCQYSAYRIL